MDESLVFDTSSHPSNISSVTNPTGSNRPGPGRGLGIVYDVLGGKLERFVNEQGKKRGWKGDWESYKEHEGSTVSDGSTTGGLAGPGRILGAVFDSAGRRLDSALSSLASNMGFGPVALHWKISDQVTKGCGPGAYGLTRTTMAGQRAFMSMQWMMEESDFIKDCRRLLRYVHSDVTVNQVTALSVLATLALSDPYLRRFLMKLGAFQAIASLRPYISRYPPRERDILQAASRKALLSFSELECNAIAKDIYDLKTMGRGGSDYVERLIENKILDLIRLLDVRNPDITYLAICHLSILIPQRKRKFEFAIPGRIDPTLEFLGWKLVIAAARDFGTLDWASVDQLVRNCLFHYNNYLWRRSTSTQLMEMGNLDAWAIILGFAFRWPELMQSTAKYILYITDEEYRFVHFGSDWVSPAHSPLLKLALDYTTSDALPPAESLDTLSPDENRLPVATQLASRFNTRVREGISSASDEVLADALLERRLPDGIPQMVVTEQFVPKSENFKLACQKLMDLAIKSQGRREKTHVRQNLAYLCIVDRYCRDGVYAALESARRNSASPDTRKRVEKLFKFVENPRNRIAAKDKLLEEQPMFNAKHFSLFRHITGGNEIHMRSFAPYGKHLMCMICLMSEGLTFLDSNAPPPSCDVLKIGLRDVLWLEIPEDDIFAVDETKHSYVLASTIESTVTAPDGSTTQDTKKRYIAIAFDESGVPQWCSVEDGDTEVWYYNMLSMRVPAKRFFVMVLRYDHHYSGSFQPSSPGGLFGRKGRLHLPLGATNVVGTLFWEPFVEKTTRDEFGLDLNAGLGLITV